MGYTHYWKSTHEISEFEWNQLAKDVSTILNTSSIPLCNWDGEPNTAPDFGDGIISFNGCGDDAHEAFALSVIPTEFSFCKTAEKPYDVIVCACLLLMARTKAWSVSSDGSEPEGEPLEENWEQAASLCAIHFEESFIQYVPVRNDE